ncbi:WD domain, G-beta repeat-containing protein, putative [Eimeria acervulina]|uniref:WD domain, G-beta repeat-containing protein, putative n=1 Tax=Eimeria acervulina TaxID=5801 RepID=U6GF94_EIMAC|nr:WD domain, G-beta repeat-containing protein, putative [Eimeria acervulina]CDI78845.1 WD domain, G-beta repeat-containing protein, putative [Eimeria acervulina]
MVSTGEFGDLWVWRAAQKKYVYIYDHQGIEIHCLRDLMLTYCLDFLPYHYLMVSTGEFGDLCYYDISTGQVVAKHRTKRGPCDVMCLNQFKGVAALGHSKGTVSLWTPNLSKPAVEMFCHHGKVTAVAAKENIMLTGGVDGVWKLFDLRRYECMHSFASFGGFVSSFDISDSNLIAVGFNSHLQIWRSDKTAKPSLYLTHELPGEVRL